MRDLIQWCFKCLWDGGFKLRFIFRPLGSSLVFPCFQGREVKKCHGKGSHFCSDCLFWHARYHTLFISLKLLIFWLLWHVCDLYLKYSVVVLSFLDWITDSTLYSAGESCFFIIRPIAVLGMFWVLVIAYMALPKTHHICLRYKVTVLTAIGREVQLDTPCG